MNEISKTPSTVDNAEQIKSYPLNELFRIFKERPPAKMIFSGIKENSVGFIFGPSKSGKTIFCENLGMLIAAGANEFLNEPIGLRGGKVLFISLEEFFSGRTERNLKQANKIRKKYGTEWINNYHAIFEDFPRYIRTNEDWQRLRKLIDYFKPNIVFIDSLSRLYSGSIEESHLAKEVMKNLRELANETHTTLIIIHHSPKLHGSPLTIDALAGSRMLGQDADFLIGINKTIDNKQYIKEVAFRYHPENNETVKLFTIDEDCLINVVGIEDERQLLTAYDGRTTVITRNQINEFMLNKSEQYNNLIPFEELKARYVSTKKMSLPALNANLNKLIEEGKIERVSKGIYKVLSK